MFEIRLKNYLMSSLRRRMMLASVLIAMVPLMVVFSVLVVQNHSGMLQRERQTYQTRLDAVAGSLNRSISKYEQAADFVANDQSILRGLSYTSFPSQQEKVTFYLETDKTLGNAQLVGGKITLYFDDQGIQSGPNVENWFDYRNLRSMTVLEQQYGPVLVDEAALGGYSMVWLPHIYTEDGSPGVVYLRRIGSRPVLGYRIPLSELAEAAGVEPDEAFELVFADGNGTAGLLHSAWAEDETPEGMITLTTRLDSGHILSLRYAEQGLPPSELAWLGLMALVYLLGVSAVGVVMYFTTRRMTGSLERFISHIGREGDYANPDALNALLAETTGKDEVSIIRRQFVQLLRRIQALNQANLETMEKQRLLEVSLTQAKLNPHLLYNSLSVIKWQAMMRDVPEIAELVDHMTRYYRAVLGKGDNIVTIGYELDMVEEYVKIVEYAHNTSYNLEIDVPGDILEAFTLKLLVQPVVENAILHGLNGKEGDKRIKITGRWREDIIELTVEDNGYGIGADVLESLQNRSYVGAVGGFGIRSIEQQLQASFGSRYGIWVESEKDRFTRVTIHMPHATREEWMGELVRPTD